MVRLPQSILDEIHDQNAEHTQLKKSRVRSLARKDARKKQRASQEQKKAQYFSSARKRPAETELQHSPESQQPKKPRIYHAPVAGSSTNPPPQQKPKKVTVVVPPPQSHARDNEAAYIAYLEKKLGYDKSRKKSSHEDDGLDDLLDWAYDLHTKNQQETENQNDGFEQEEDIPDEEISDEEDNRRSESGSEFDDDDGGEEEEEEWGGIGASSRPDVDFESDEDEVELRLTFASTSATRYIPPHSRKKDDAPESEVITRLRKQLKGLLNRMSEQNLNSVIDSIEDLYRNNRRHDVTASMTTLVIEGISSHSMLLDSYVVLHAALISSLHKIIGIEFAAYFVQNVVETYERHYTSFTSTPTLTTPQPDANADDSEPKAKETSNLMVLLSELYNFQVISSILVFDLVRQLLQDELTEFNVELLLRLMRNSGQQLRHDDPSALRDIIEIVQKKALASGRSENSRTRFMIETLTNLKNNKLQKRNVGTQNQGAEAVERMKKFLSSLSKRKHVIAHDALRVSLADLHSAESNGKWWLVGAAWGGNPLVEAQGNKNKTAAHTNGELKIAANETTNDLLKLARKQGMNTDIRRSIFVVLMSSEDYVDACDRLVQLNLTEIQRREIIRVLLHCCSTEKSYNPYYTLIAQHLCKQTHSYKITLQFCLWDFLRELGETGVGGAQVLQHARDNDVLGFDGGKAKKNDGRRARNVATAYGWWISKDIVDLSILKAVEFMVIKPQTQTFLQDLLFQVFIDSHLTTPLLNIRSQSRSLASATGQKSRNRKSVEEIFLKATRNENLALGLVYFLSNSFTKFQLEYEGAVGNFVKWASEVAVETLRAGVDIVPML